MTGWRVAIAVVGACGACSTPAVSPATTVEHEPTVPRAARDPEHVASSDPASSDASFDGVLNEVSTPGYQTRQVVFEGREYLLVRRADGRLAWDGVIYQFAPHLSGSSPGAMLRPPPPDEVIEVVRRTRPMLLQLRNSGQTRTTPNTFIASISFEDVGRFQLEWVQDGVITETDPRGGPRVDAADHVYFSWHAGHPSSVRVEEVCCRYGEEPHW